MVFSSLRFVLRPRRFVPMTRGFSTRRVVKVLISGGGYGGLSTALNLMKIPSGKPQLSCPLPPPEMDWSPQTPPQIVLIDERDGICRSLAHLKPPSPLRYLRNTENGRSFDGRATGPDKR
jgi:hypothetical protein